MALLTHQYDPTGAAQVLIQAMESGKRRQAQQEQIIAGLSKAIADDRRHALEFDRLQAFNAAKLAEDTSRYNARTAEEQRRYNEENSAFTIPAVGTASSPLEGPLPAATAAPADEFTAMLAQKRADQMKQGMEALDQADTPTPIPQLGSPAADGPAMEGPPAPPAAPADPNALPAGPVAQGAPQAGPDLMPANPPRQANSVRRHLHDLASMNIPGQPPLIRKKDVRAALPGMLRSEFAASTRANAQTESMEEATKGMTFVPEHGTYKNADGAEFFVGRSAGGKATMKPWQPDKVKASRWVQGSDGKAYALGSNGEPMQPIPDGVDLQFSPSKPQTVKDNTGNVFILEPGGATQLVLPAQSKMTAKEQSDYTGALVEMKTAQALLDAKRPAYEKSWFGVGKKEIQEAEDQVRGAQATIDTMRERYPQLAPPPLAKPPGAPAAAPDERSQSLANAKAAIAKKPDVKDAVRKRLLDNGYTEQELQAAGL